MNIRGQFSDFFFETELPAMAAKIWKTFRAKPAMYKRILGHDTTSRSIEQYAEMVGVGLPSVIAETEDAPVDSFMQGLSKTYRPLKYGLGIACSQELIEDDKHGIVSRRSVALANSMAQAREIQAAAIYNDGFTTNGKDGVPLFSASHPLIKAGGVQSNILAAAADLDVTSLELALTDWELIKTHEGFLQGMPTPRLLVASQNRWNAAEITKSNMRSDTPNNAINAFKYGENGGPIETIVWPYLTDPDAWFLIAPPDETETLWLDRKAPYLKSDYIERSETGYVFMRYRAIAGFHGFSGNYGTPGA